MTVLLLGQPEPGIPHAEFLRSQGFSVIFPSSRKEALSAIQKREFDAVLLSYSLSSDTAEELAELVRQKCPGCPLVVVTVSEHEDSRIQPDEIVLAEESPQAMLAALRRVERRKIRRVK